jgi:hypothetical protein
MAEDKTLLPLHFLVEAILVDDVPTSPYEAVKARVAAGRARFAGDNASLTAHLETAVAAVEGVSPINWRDALRANVELGLHLASVRSFPAAERSLRRAHYFLDTYFGDRNAGGQCLLVLIGTLARLNAGGCCGCGGCATDVVKSTS